MEEPILDCLIIGGGPAGLTAAIYLARFHLDILVVDGGKSRASWIPCTRNLAGFPDGIGGKELLRRMRDQACKYGAKIETEFVTRLERDERLDCSPLPGVRAAATARSVLLATGVTNRRPPMDEELHDDALARGLIRYCPICDGYEVTDKKRRRDRQRQPRRRRGVVPSQLHRRRDPDRARQGVAPEAGG